jgi:membrane peptidoglycan carboxypeptidase
VIASGQEVVRDGDLAVPNGSADVRKWIANYDGRFKGLIPMREALAESRNAVAIWLTEHVGIDSVLRTARSLGVQTRLQPYATTALVPLRSACWSSRPRIERWRPARSCSRT